MKTTLMVINGSHPCQTVERALELKRIAFRRVELLPSMQPALRPFFGGGTVPAIRFDDGRRVQGSRAIVRELERRVPEPALYGAPEIEEAERWGDERYQQIPRDILWPAVKGHPEVLHAFQAGSSLPALPLPAIRLMAPGIVEIERRLNHTGESRCRQAIAELPALLDHVDELIASGVLGGPEANAADLQIAPTTRLLHAIADVRPLIAGRPAEAHAFSWLGPNLAEVPQGTIPESWLPASAAAAAAQDEVTSR